MKATPPCISCHTFFPARATTGEDSLGGRTDSTGPYDDDMAIAQRHFVMSFSKTSRDISLRHGWLLIATCLTPSGFWRYTTLNLQYWLGVDDGRFSLFGHDFHKQSKNEYLEGTVLHAELQSSDGAFTHSKIDLDDIVANDEGDMVPYVPPCALALYTTDVLLVVSRWVGCLTCSRQWRSSFPNEDGVWIVELSVAHLQERPQSCSLCYVLGEVVRRCYSAQELLERETCDRKIRFRIAKDKALVIGSVLTGSVTAEWLVWTAAGKRTFL